MNRSITFAAALVCGLVLSAPARAGDDDSYQWYSSIREGNADVYFGRPDKALEKYQKALSLASNEEEKADALVAIATAHENAMRRGEAIGAYERLIGECPTSGHLPKVYCRLGELHRSITLTPPTASQADEDQLASAMTNDKALYYFEKAVASGPAFSSYVIGAKIYLSAVHLGLRRKDDAMTVLHEVAAIEPGDVTAPDYAGPFEKRNDERVTASERLDRTREKVLRLRKVARDRLVEWTGTPGDPEATVSALRALAERYKGTEVEAMANERIKTITADLEKQTAGGS